MATLKIKIENSKFISHNNVDVEEFTENLVKGNGWIVKIDENGEISCTATEIDEDGTKKELRFTYIKQILKLELEDGDKGTRIIRLTEFRDWNNEGTIGLSGGILEKRRVYFRKKEFQDFLDKYNIFSVRHINPNVRFKMRYTYNDGEKVYFDELKSDGNIIQRFSSVNVPQDGDGTTFNEYYSGTVRSATWVCKTSWMKGEIINRVLYTELDPVELEGLNVL